MMQQAAETLLPLAARAQGRKLCSIDASPVFSVDAAWAARLLQAEAGIVTVQTPAELEAAVTDADVRTVFVPRDTFGWSVFEKILSRHSPAKTFYWEE